MRAVLFGAILALVVAPAAEAAKSKKLGDFRMVSLKVSKSAEVAKTPDQAAKWGGIAGAPFDPCYHQACDTVDNLDMAGAETLADGGAHVLATLAEDPDLRATLNAGGGAATQRAARGGRASRPVSLGGELTR
jgi:hypothetical protein